MNAEYFSLYFAKMTVVLIRIGKKVTQSKNLARLQLADSSQSFTFDQYKKEIFMSSDKPVPPQMKQKVHIYNTYRRRIMFLGTADVLPLLQNYGTITKVVDDQERYALEVDPRYDFDEMKAYMEQL